MSWAQEGQGSLVGCRLWESHRVRHDWSNLAAAAAAVYLGHDPGRDGEGVGK